MKKMITVLLFGAALAVTGCKKDDSTSSGTGTASGTAMKKPVAGTGTATASGTAAATGTASGTASGTAAPAAGGATGIAECDDYMAQMDAMGKCSKMPDASKAAMQQGADAIKQSVDAWKQAGSPDAAKAGLVQGCKLGADALKQSLSAIGLLVAFMALYIDNDGHGRMPSFRHAPRSHEADLFEPRSLV